MKIKLNTILAGPNLSGQPGDIIDVAPKTGRELIAGGYAVDIEPKAKPKATPKASAPETADQTPPETAAKPKPQRRKSGKK